MSDQPKCELCGEPMPPGEEMFNYHGYSGDCPKPPLERKAAPDPQRLRQIIRNLISACQYAAGSFAQVPSDQSVPPIVLHDCKDKLEAAWRAAAEEVGE